MNILFYCDEYPPSQTGGIGSVTKIIAEDLVKKGHSIYIIGYYPFERIQQEYTNENGVHIYRYNKNYRTNRIQRAIFSKFLKRTFFSTFLIQKEVSFIENKICQLIKQKNIQILELTDYYQFNKEAPHLTFKRFNIPVVLRIHGSAYFIAKNQGYNKLNYIRQNDINHFIRCDYITAVSQFALNSILNDFPEINKKKQCVIYNPIENDFLKKNQPNNSLTILFIGKLVKSKGCYSLLKAFNIIAAQHPNIQLQLIGGGDIIKAKSFVNPQYLDRVHFCGYYNREQIKKAIDNCLFACIPTFFENFSMVALEIMARQKALIYTSRTSGKEIITNGENGFLINPENIREIATTINLLIENKTLRNNIAQKAYQQIEQNFTTSTITNQIENFYQHIINNESPKHVSK